MCFFRGCFNLHSQSFELGIGELSLAGVKHRKHDLLVLNGSDHLAIRFGWDNAIFVLFPLVGSESHDLRHLRIIHAVTSANSFDILRKWYTMPDTPLVIYLVEYEVILPLSGEFFTRVLTDIITYIYLYLFLAIFMLFDGLYKEYTTARNGTLYVR